jgi:hypothetical protein
VVVGPLILRTAGRSMFRIACVAAMALCSSTATGAVRHPVPDDFFITLGRTTCFGECPAYSVSIDAKGNVTYEGRKFVRVEGIQHDRIPVARVAALAEQIDRIGFFELEDWYQTIQAPDGSRISITDLPKTFVSVTRGGRIKQILDYLGAPDSLKQLEKQIDEAANTKRWVTLDISTLRQMIRDGWAPSASARSELLRKALQEDNVPVIKALLEHGADPNGGYYGTGTTPLMMAASAAAARAVLDAGGNPLARNSNGATALFPAVDRAPALTEVLLKAGVPPDERDAYGHTPLFKAACAGNAGVVQRLLERGADPSSRNAPGPSAVECAREGQRSERLYPQPMIDPHPLYVKDFDTVIALLQEAQTKRQPK